MPDKLKRKFDDLGGGEQQPGRVTGFGGDPGALSHASNERAQSAASSPAPTPPAAIASSPDRHGSSPTLDEVDPKEWPSTVWSLTGEEYRNEKDMDNVFGRHYCRVQSDGSVNREEVFQEWGGGLSPLKPASDRPIVDPRDYMYFRSQARFPVSAQRPHLPELPARESGAAQFPEPNAAHTTLQQSAPGSSFRGAEPAGGLPNRRSDSPRPPAGATAPQAEVKSARRSKGSPAL